MAQKNKKKKQAKQIIGLVVGLLAVIAFAIVIFWSITSRIALDECAPPDCSNVDEETCHLMGCRQITLWDSFFEN